MLHFLSLVYYFLIRVVQQTTTTSLYNINGFVHSQVERDHVSAFLIGETDLRKRETARDGFPFPYNYAATRKRGFWGGLGSLFSFFTEQAEKDFLADVFGREDSPWYLPREVVCTKIYEFLGKERLFEEPPALPRPGETVRNYSSTAAAGGNGEELLADRRGRGKG